MGDVVSEFLMSQSQKEAWISITGGLKKEETDSHSIHFTPVIFTQLTHTDPEHRMILRMWSHMYSCLVFSFDLGFSVCSEDLPHLKLYAQIGTGF